MDIRFPEQNNNSISKTSNNMKENLESRETIIKVIGVGGGGTNAVNRIRAANVKGVELIAVNTDNDSLRQSCADSRVSLGTGLGVGGDPEKGQLYAEQDIDKIEDIIRGANMVFITTGMGGGTGTGAAPVIAKVARDLNKELEGSKKEGILVVGVVTKPFNVEGSKRIENANKGIAKLREYTDALIVIPNDKLLMVDSKTNLIKSFEMIDDVLRRAIESITDTITKTGKMNIDFQDVKAILQNSDNAIIALGEGQNLEEAFKKAIENKFVEGDSITNADGLLVNVSYSKQNEPTVDDQTKLFESIKENFKSYNYFKPGLVINDELDTKIKVSIIASFKKQQEQQEEKDLIDIMSGTNSKEKVEEINPFDRPAYETHKTTKI